MHGWARIMTTGPNASDTSALENRTRMVKDCWKSAPITTYALRTRSSPQNHATRYPGDIPGLITGTSLTLLLHELHP